MAGIYIPGMEMPSCCGDCPMCDLNWELCRGTRKEIENVYADDGVAVFCPFVLVPDHGDLIERDALFSVYADLLDGGDVRSVVPRIVIDTAPTILPSDKEGAE